MNNKIYMGSTLGHDGKYYTPVMANSVELYNNNALGQFITTNGGKLYYVLSGKVIIADSMNLSKEAEISFPSGTSVVGLLVDDRYIYVYYQFSQKRYIVKIDKNGLSTVATFTHATNEHFVNLDQDGEFIYAAGRNDGKVYKINKSTMTLSLEIPIYLPVFCLIGGNIIYVWSNQRVIAFNSVTGVQFKISGVLEGGDPKMVLSKGKLVALNELNYSSQIIEIDINTFISETWTPMGSLASMDLACEEDYIFIVGNDKGSSSGNLVIIKRSNKVVVKNIRVSDRNATNIHCKHPFIYIGQTMGAYKNVFQIIGYVKTEGGL
ncbi:YncE family protein [Tissierella creatinophila]|uniref:Uncharacterized protein n=1 Tax=Tissierella creatinophila DSM 6911 TaxID=1123403 RepID=A0A1U7M6H2_TISCR|nr:hypothetical protein [Tissierella creatinophila]OLS02875.1 hypothetical protein TICRE_11480 [Tissierella creatinophila DSM 6911]